jgi:hypothetical protein
MIRRRRDDISKNHVAGQCVSRDQLSYLSGQLNNSGIGALYFIYHPNTKSLAVHSQRPITCGQLFRRTNIPWIPFKGKQEDIPFVKEAFKGKQEDIPLKEAKSSLVEKIMLSVFEEKPIEKAAAVAEDEKNQLTARIKLLEDYQKNIGASLAQAHAIIESLRTQSRAASNEVMSSECAPLAAKAVNTTNEASSYLSDEWAGDNGESAGGDNEAADGGNALIPVPHLAPYYRVATPIPASSGLVNIAKYDAAARRNRGSRRGDPGAVVATSPAVLVRMMELPAPPVLPAGYRVAAEVMLGKALVGQWVLYYWPSEGWVRGRVGAVSRSVDFSHVVKYGPKSALGAAAVPSLLDAASHGPAGRWLLLQPIR